MGCSISRIEESELVLRCKNRKRLMKQAIAYRHEFARAHMAYLQGLKNLGMSIRQFAEGDDHHHCHSPSDHSPTLPILSLLPASSSPDSLPVSPSSITASSPSSSTPAPATPRELSTPPLSPTSTASSYSPHRDTARIEDAEVMGMAVASSNAEKCFLSSGNRPVGSPSSPMAYRPNDSLTSFRPLPSEYTPLLYRPSSPSTPQDSTWDIFGFFQTLPVPFHSQEQKMIKRVEEGENLSYIRESEGIPDLEEDEIKLDVKENGPNILMKDDETPVDSNDGGFLEVGFRAREDDLSSVQIPEKVETLQEEARNIVEEPTLNGEAEEDDQGNKELVVVTALGQKNIKDVGKGVNDHFIRAYASGRDVARLLEFDDIYSHKPDSELKDSVRVFNAITFHWSNKKPLVEYACGESADSGMSSSHSSTLERLYAWERKLYHEIKACELLRTAFDRKLEQLKYQDAKGEDSKTIDRTRSTMKTLDTQLMVALKAIHSISSSIQKLTNDDLYPQIVEILAGLIDMWTVMWDCHRTQAGIALEMRSLENSFAGEEMSEFHRKATSDLESQLSNWQMYFSHWITSQKYYIDTLVAWLRLCRMEPETDSKGRIVSPYWSGGPPIFSLAKNWQQALKHLEEKQEVVDAVSNFLTVLHSLQLNQMEELHHRRRVDILAKDLQRRSPFLQGLEDQYVGLQIDVEEEQLAGAERRLALYNIKNRVDEEKQKLVDTMHSRQEVTLASFKANLPKIFETMASFAMDALKEYEKIQYKLDMRTIRFSERWARDL